MSEGDEILRALNRNTEAVRENTEEVKRLREEFVKLHANAPAPRDTLEAKLEGLTPVAAALLRATLGGGGRKKGR